MKKITFLISFWVLLMACQRNNSETVTLENASKMKVTNIFRKDSIKAFIALYGNANQSLAEQYAQKGESAVNTDLKKSIYYFKRALTLFPEESIYRRFGDAMFEKGKYDEAHNSYYTLIDLNKAQTEAEYIKIIKNELLSSNDYTAYAFVDDFKSLGYSYESIQKKILTDDKIQANLPQMKLRDFTSNVNNVYGVANETEDSESTKGASFEDYRKKFEPVALPFSVGKKELQHFVYNRGDDMEYEEYNPTEDFNRFTEHSLMKATYYVATDFQYFVKEANGLVVLIHAADSSAEAVPADFRCTFHRILIYNTQGELYDSKVIGLHAGDRLVTYKIDNDLTITTEEFVRKWKRPFQRDDIDNEIVSVEKLGEKKYKILETGKVGDLQMTP